MNSSAASLFQDPAQALHDGRRMCCTEHQHSAVGTCLLTLADSVTAYLDSALAAETCLPNLVQAHTGSTAAILLSLQGQRSLRVAGNSQLALTPNMLAHPGPPCSEDGF